VESQGVKANVVFFDRKPAAADPWTKETWVYDLRTNKHFTLKTSPLRSEDLADFVESYCPDDRSKRVESERFHRFSYDELIARDKANLDITWLRDDSLDDASALPAPGVLAAEIVEELEGRPPRPLRRARRLASGRRDGRVAGGSAPAAAWRSPDHECRERMTGQAAT
jgi:type I restriction enzyme M protein